MKIYRYLVEIQLDPTVLQTKRTIVEYYIPQAKLTFNFISFLNMFETDKPRSNDYEEIDVPDNLVPIMMDIYTKIVVTRQYLLEQIEEEADHERKKKETDNGEDIGEDPDGDGDKEE